MKRLLINLAILLQGLVLPAEELSFEHLGAAQGMAQTAIRSITQDKAGNIWFIGDGKVFRYDGFECSSWPDISPVYGLASDKDGGIWALCHGRLKYFDEKTASFLELEESPEWLSKQYFGIVGLSSGELLFFNGGGCTLGAYDPRDNSFSPILSSDFNVTAVHEADSCLFLGCSDGTVCMMEPSADEPKVLMKASASVSSLLKDGNENLWVGTRGDGLYRYSASSKQRYSRGAGSLSSSVVLSLGTDGNGRIWAGTLVGLNIIDTEKGETRKFLKDNFDGSSLSHNTVRCIFRDTQGGMWLGTYFGGINYWHPFRNRFRHIKPDAGGNSINDDVISCIVEDSDGLVWVGTNMGGVNCYNPSTGVFKHYLVSGNSERTSEFNDVKAILCDEDKVLVGAYGAGLSIIDRASGEVTHNPEWNSVYSLDRAESGGWWIGATDGLYLLAPDGLSSKQFSKGRVVLLHHDSHGRFWVSYSDRTELYASDGLLENIAPAPLASLLGICDIFESQDGKFWLSTPSGLWTYEDVSGVPARCEDIGESGIYGVEQDNSQYLWVAASFGLCRYDPAKGRIRTFTPEDGMAVSLFQEYSHCRMGSGDMLFGGIGGIVMFDPEQMAPDSLCPMPVINAIYVNGRELKASDNTGVLPCDIRLAGAIRLRHDQNHVMFRFSAPDYDCGTLTRFRYRLEGFDERWQTTGKDRTATYSNLPKGKYLLRVEAVNPDGVASRACRELGIRVLPPWYRCNAAIIAWMLLLLAAAVISVRTGFRHHDMANELKLQKLEREHRKEISRMKVLRFINSGTPAGSSAGKKIVTEIEASDEHFMLEVMGLVEGNLSNPDFNTEMLARKMNMSRTAVYLRIKKITGASPLDLIRKIRFTAACDMLAEGKLTVAEIAYKAGSRSPSSFIAAFRKYVGYTPMEYARRESGNTRSGL